MGDAGSVSTDQEAVTVELPQPSNRRKLKFPREMSGALAAGMVLLAVLVLGAQVYALVRGTPGPGPIAVVGHLGAGAFCLACQRMLDRRTGRATILPGALMVVVAVATLWFFWWS
jgi:hypothetical protein